MKHLKLLLLSATLLLTITACEFRPITEDYRPGRPVNVEVDWSLFNEPAQTGMTLYFYPTDGNRPYVSHSTNDIHRTTVQLREGEYNVIVMNQSPGEFGSFRFHDIHCYEDFYVRTADLASKWYTTKADEEEKVGWNPERLAFDIAENFVVEALSPELRNRASALSGEDLETPVLRLTPESVIGTFKLIVHIDRVYNLRAVRAAVVGLAEGHIPSEERTGPNKVTHLLDEGWKLTRWETDPVMGTVTNEFTTFGLPHKLEDFISKDIVLKLSFLLVDNQTTQNFNFHIGKRIKKEINPDTGEDVFIAEIGLYNENDPTGGLEGGGGEGETSDLYDANEPPALKDVKPEGGSDGGFDVEVKDWGEEVEVEVPL